MINNVLFLPYIGGCVEGVEENHLKKKICYCKKDYCNSAMGHWRNQNYFYFEFIILIVNLIF